VTPGAGNELARSSLPPPSSSPLSRRSERRRGRRRRRRRPEKEWPIRRLNTKTCVKRGERPDSQKPLRQNIKTSQQVLAHG